MIYEKEKRYIIPFDDVPAARAEMPEISVEARKANFTEVETGFPEETAVREAQRCLSCRRCLGCALCWAECEPEAIDFDIPDEILEREFDEVIISRGQENAFQPIRSDLGYGEYAHVITDLQFERMLSPTGPTEGLVLSPLDGDIPWRIALVQGEPEGGEDHLLSSVVYGINESVLALDRTEGLQVALISPLCEAFQAHFADAAAGIDGLEIIDGIPTAVRQNSESPLLTVSYQNSTGQNENTFDMVVVLTRPTVSPETAALQKKFQLE